MNLYSETKNKFFESEDQRIEELELSAPKQIFTVEKGIVFGDSEAYYNNFAAALGTKLNASMLSAAYSGSQVATGLAELANEFYVPMKGGNHVKNSNDFTALGWGTSGTDITVSKQTFKDGTLWNKVTKTTNAVDRGLLYDSLSDYPAAAGGTTGMFVSFELHIPDTSENPIKSLQVVLMELTTYKAINVSYTNLKPNTKYFKSIFVPISDATLAQWTATTPNKCVRFLMNKADGNVPGVCYIRNVEVSFEAPAGFENYVPSGASVVPSGSVVVTKVDIQKYELKNVDVIVVGYTGRNEVNGNVDAYSWFKALDKLLHECAKYAPVVIPFNCPPQRNTNSETWLSNDGFEASGNNFYKLFNKLMAKWNTGVDVYGLYKSLVASGQYKQSDIFGSGDSIHHNVLGRDIIQNEIIKQIVSNRRLHNYSRPEMQNTIKFYMPSTTTGTWTINAETTGDSQSFFKIPLGMDKEIALASSTMNDAITWSNISGDQLHIITRVDGKDNNNAGYGTFDIIIDEGAANQRTISINTFSDGVYNRRTAMFVCELGSGTHTVKIKVTSSGKPVKIHGILVI